jgi:hypothetical protein
MITGLESLVQFGTLRYSEKLDDPFIHFSAQLLSNRRSYSTPEPSDKVLNLRVRHPEHNADTNPKTNTNTN